MTHTRFVRTLVGLLLTKAAVVGAWYLYQSKLDKEDEDLERKLDEEFGSKKPEEKNLKVEKVEVEAPVTKSTKSVAASKPKKAATSTKSTTKSARPTKEDFISQSPVANAVKPKKAAVKKVVKPTIVKAVEVIPKPKEKRVVKKSV